MGRLGSGGQRPEPAFMVAWHYHFANKFSMTQISEFPRQPMGRVDAAYRGKKRVCIGIRPR
jgi:hypothetical protein